MLKELLSVLRQDSLLSRAQDRSLEMLNITIEMFKNAKVVLRTTEETNKEFDIDEQDHIVNKYQRTVRKDVLNDLILGDKKDLPSGLVIASIVIDIERIGDYTKNIVDISNNYEGKLNAGKYEEALVKIEDEVLSNFENTIKCFQENNSELASKLFFENKALSKEADEILFELMKTKDSEFSTGKVVALTLYLRSLKRINSHLRNIVSSVSNPFHRIGYKPKKNK